MSSSSHTTSPVDVSPHSEVLTGIRLGLPILIGYVPLGIAYGVLAVKNGIPAMWAVAMSVFVFAGAGQFIAAGMIGGGASIPAVALANVTGILHTRCEIPAILAGILTQIGLYSINLRIMGRSNTPLLKTPTIFKQLVELTGLGQNWMSMLVGLIFAAARRAADGGFLPAI